MYDDKSNKEAEVICYLTHHNQTWKKQLRSTYNIILPHRVFPIMKNNEDKNTIILFHDYIDILINFIKRKNRLPSYLRFHKTFTLIIKQLRLNSSLQDLRSLPSRYLRGVVTHVRHSWAYGRCRGWTPWWQAHHAFWRSLIAHAFLST